MATATRSPNPATPPSAPESSDRRPARVRFTVEDYHRLAGLGFLHEDARVELIDGDLIATSPIGPRHAGEVNRLNALLSHRVAGRALVAIQNPIQLDEHSEPEPDLTLVRPRDDFYGSARPRPDDVLLLIEVMDSSPDDDRGTRLGLYARFALTEVWLIDLTEQRIELHRLPNEGTYTERLIRNRGRTVAPTRFPDVELDGDAISGPAATTVEPGPLPPPRA